MWSVRLVRGNSGRYVETLLNALITAEWAVEASEVGSYTNSMANGRAALSFPYAFSANLSQPGVATFEDPHVITEGRAAFESRRGLIF